MGGIFLTKKRWVRPKVPYFFSRGKVYRALSHSISVFFFHISEKKYTNCFFFLTRKSLEATHSILSDICKKGPKKVKKGKLYSFLKFFSFWCFFFLSPNQSQKKSVLFFSQEKFTRHSLTHSQEPEKKKQHSHSLTRILPKKIKTNFSS